MPIPEVKKFIIVLTILFFFVLCIELLLYNMAIPKGGIDRRAPISFTISLLLFDIAYIGAIVLLWRMNILGLVILAVLWGILVVASFRYVGHPVVALLLGAATLLPLFHIWKLLRKS